MAVSNGGIDVSIDVLPFNISMSVSVGWPVRILFRISAHVCLQLVCG